MRKPVKPKSNPDLNSPRVVFRVNRKLHAELEAFASESGLLGASGAGRYLMLRGLEHIRLQRGQAGQTEVMKGLAEVIKEAMKGGAS